MKWFRSQKLRRPAQIHRRAAFWSQTGPLKSPATNQEQCLCQSAPVVWEEVAWGPLSPGLSPEPPGAIELTPRRRYGFRRLDLTGSQHSVFGSPLDRHCHIFPLLSVHQTGTHYCVWQFENGNSLWPRRTASGPAPGPVLDSRTSTGALTPLGMRSATQ